MLQSKTTTVILVLVLVMNIVLLMRVGDLQEQLQNLSRNYNNLQSGLYSISGEVNSVLEQFTREQSWITPVQIDEEKSKVGKEDGLLVLNWQIKDFQEGAKVVFHYRESETGEFRAVPAENKGAGYFAVNLPVKISLQPFWDISVRVEDDESRKRAETAIMHQRGNEQTLGYYISMQTKEGIKSSEIAYLNYDYLAQVKYEPIRGHVVIGNYKYDIFIFESSPGSADFQSVTAKFYDGSRLVATQPIAADDGQNKRKTYSLQYEAGSESISHLVIEVKYDNGEVFSREIRA